MYPEPQVNGNETHSELSLVLMQGRLDGCNIALMSYAGSFALGVGSKRDLKLQ